MDNRIAELSGTTLSDSRMDRSELAAAGRDADVHGSKLGGSTHIN